MSDDQSDKERVEVGVGVAIVVAGLGATLYSDL